MKNILTQNQEIHVFNFIFQIEHDATFITLSLVPSIIHALMLSKAVHVYVYTYTCKTWNSDSMWIVEQILVCQIPIMDLKTLPQNNQSLLQGTAPTYNVNWEYSGAKKKLAQASVDKAKFTN